MKGEPLLERLVAERYSRLVSYARIMMRERADAEDAVHEALIAVFSRPRSFDSLDACEAYVRRAIATRSIDEHRRRGRERAVLVTLRSDATQTVNAADFGHADADALASALALLSPRERACVTLRFVDHLSVAETAQALSLAQGSVKRYVSDGIAKLNATLGTHQADAEPSFVSIVGTQG